MQELGYKPYEVKQMNRRLVLVVVIVAILCILFGVGITVMGSRLSKGFGNIYSSVMARLPHRKAAKPELIVVDSKSEANNLRAAASDALRQHGAMPAAPPINENKVAGSKMRPSESNDASSATAATSEEKEVREGSNSSGKSKEYNRETNPVLPSGKSNPLAKPTPDDEERAALKKMWDEGDENLRRLMREEGYVPEEELEKIKKGNKSEAKESNDKEDEKKTENGEKSEGNSDSAQNRTTSGAVNPGKLGEMAVRLAREYNQNNPNETSNGSASAKASPDLPKTTKPGEGSDNAYLVNPVLQVVAVERRNRGNLGSTSGQLGGANELTTIFDLRNHVAANGFIGRYTVNINVGDYRGGYAPPMFNVKLVSLSGNGNAVNYRIDRLMWSRSVTGNATATFSIPATDTNQVGILVSASSVDPRCNVSYSVQLSK